MPIEILDYPEPLTAAALASSTERVLIKSDAYHQLLHELRRYCNTQTSGRSFLIAGHRGSGKTTLALSAFEKILRESQAGKLEMRPLMVQLLGPSLLPHFDKQEESVADKEPGKKNSLEDTIAAMRDVINKNDTGALNARERQNPAVAEKTITATAREDSYDFENVLVQFTLALHRAVVNELAQAYQQRMMTLAFPRGKLWRSDLERIGACLEAPGQLALELDEYPGKARLRVLAAGTSFAWRVVTASGRFD
jgi:hypothetical protein